ncbi:MAG: glycosyl transferase family 90 [Rikenellaceae bacterium]
MNLRYLFNSGKNNKIKYYLRSHLQCAIPRGIFSSALNSALDSFNSLPTNEQRYIMERVEYYCKLPKATTESDIRKLLPEGSPQLKDHTLSKRGKYPSSYFFDTYEFTRYFNLEFRWNHLFGDINYVPDVPSITKSRPIGDHNSYSVLMKLNKNRHFIRVKDHKSFAEKSNKAIFRGDVTHKPDRCKFVEQFINHPLCDIGVVSRHPNSPIEWEREPKSIFEHLDYKFIFALEGNDVASNLKWVMSSNSIAVMPKPTCETWFMEGKLEAGVHYIEIAPDFSDLEQRLQYYIDHPQEAVEISRNANRYVGQFWNKKREHLISLMTLQRYFEATGQAK